MISAVCTPETGPCRAALILFRPVAGADRYVVTHPDRDDRRCVGLGGVCVVTFDDVVASDCGFRLVAVVGSERLASASFCIDRIG